MPLVISMTLNKTESLRLHSSNDISSQFQVHIMPKRKHDRISDPAKKQAISADRHHSCDVLIWSWSFYSSDSASSQRHITADVRDTRHTFPTVDWFLISYAVHCDQIPTTLLADLENTGTSECIIAKCYLCYTGNLIRLEDGTKLISPTPRRRHSTPIGLYRDVWIAAIAWSRTRVTTLESCLPWKKRCVDRESWSANLSDIPTISHGDINTVIHIESRNPKAFTAIG